MQRIDKHRNLITHWNFWKIVFLVEGLYAQKFYFPIFLAHAVVRCREAEFMENET